MKRKIINLLLVTAIILTVAGCGKSSTANSKETEPLRIGVSAGPHEDIVNKLKEVRSI